MRHPFSDLRPFRHDPLRFVLEVGDRSDEQLVPLALGPQRMYLVNDPTLVKPLLKRPDCEVDKGRLIQKLRTVIGDSVVILSGDEHAKRRQALHALLARSAVEALAPSISAEIRSVAVHAARSQSVDAHALGSQLALRIVSVVAFGHHVLSAADEEALVQSVLMIEDDVAEQIFRAFPPSPWRALAERRRRRQSKAVMTRIVSRVRERASDSSAIRALSTLGLRDEEITNEVLTLLLAGHHTTGAAVAWLLDALARQPGLAFSIADEARSLTLPNGEIDVSRMPTAKISIAAVREIMRLYPSSWWFSREVKQDVALGGRRLKPGTSLLISPWMFHRSERFWSEPDAFKLDRGYNNPAYLPFGAGPRACVGMGLAMFELQLIALELASAFQINASASLAPPKPMVMLMPPSLPIRMSLREDASSAYRLRNVA